MKQQLVFDEFMAWPYVEPYGMVAAPKQPKVKKPRKARAVTKPKFKRCKHSWAAPFDGTVKCIKCGAIQTQRTQRAALPAKVTTDGKPKKRRSPRKPKLILEAHAEVWQAPILEATPQGFAETFSKGATE